MRAYEWQQGGEPPALTLSAMVSTIDAARMAAMSSLRILITSFAAQTVPADGSHAGTPAVSRKESENASGSQARNPHAGRHQNPLSKSLPNRCSTPSRLCYK